MFDQIVSSVDAVVLDHLHELVVGHGSLGVLISYCFSLVFNQTFIPTMVDCRGLVIRVHVVVS